MSERAKLCILFPYTTLFRSGEPARLARDGHQPRARRRRPGPAAAPDRGRLARRGGRDRKSTRLNSSHQIISYAVFCLKKKKINKTLYVGYVKHFHRIAQKIA